MSNTRITVDPDFVVGPVRPRTFGSFVEHWAVSSFVDRCFVGQAAAAV